MMACGQGCFLEIREFVGGKQYSRKLVSDYPGLCNLSLQNFAQVRTTNVL